MILYILCSVLLIPIQIYCESPAADHSDGSLANEYLKFGRIHTRRSPNPPDNYLINKLARQYLAWKTLNKQNIPNICQYFDER